MTFRKSALAYMEMKIFAAGMTLAVALCLYFVFASGELIFLFLPIMGMCIVLFLVCCLKHEFNEYITITETGILCRDKKDVLWEYKWCEIAELRKCPVDRNIGVVLILYDKDGEPEQFPRNGHFFQLCRPARRILKEYGKSITKRK